MALLTTIRNFEFYQFEVIRKKEGVSAGDYFVSMRQTLASSITRTTPLCHSYKL